MAQSEPVQQRTGQAVLAAALEIAGVGLEYLGRAVDQRCRDRLEDGVLALAESEPRAIQQPIDVAGERVFGAFHGSIIPALN